MATPPMSFSLCDPVTYPLRTASIKPRIQFNHDWGGRPWDREAKEVLEKYNPINFVHKWSTPQLVIHGSKDYRLPETDGIGAFHALKQCAYISLSMTSDRTILMIRSRKGLPARLVIFPDENHWVLNHGNR
jgi:dipeptidyl aminopeptidase/acylaminoacyl peptidase